MPSFTTLLSIALLALSAVAVPAPTIGESGLIDLTRKADLVDLTARQSCSDVYVWFARGTTELGTLGSVVGPGLQTAVAIALRGKNVRFTGLDYPALVSGYLAGGDPGGARDLANAVTSIANSCPNAKIVISGYSQGAQVTHLAARRLSTAIQDRVNAVVTFGDPYRDTSLPGVLQGRRKTFCAFGDLICDGLPVILAAHLGYGADASAAATFIAGKV